MNATLTFDLSDPEDQRRHRQYVHAPDMAAALWSFAQEIRKKMKHTDEDTWPLDDLSRTFYEALSSNGVTLDEVVW
jgi:hypothetical protein